MTLKSLKFLGCKQKKQVDIILYFCLFCVHERNTHVQNHS